MKKILITLLFLTLVTCCNIYRENQPGAKEFNEILKIPIEDDAERLRKFLSYPVDKQVDIYLYGMDSIAPSYTHFGDFLAYEGEDKVPYILERIKTSKEDSHKFYLMEIIRKINRNCNCVKNEDLEELESVKRSILYKN